MLNLLTERESLWEYLISTKKPIYIYGMGDGALKIISVLERLNIKLAGIYASDEFVRGHSFYGFVVKKLSEVQAEAGDFITLLAFAAQNEPLLSKIHDMANHMELYAPDVPVVMLDDEVFDIEYLKRHDSEFDFVYSKLADELSKKTLIDIINFKISGKISYLKRITSDISEVYENVIRPTATEDYIDLGAYNGDTVMEFLSYSKGMKSLIAFEPDKKNFKKLEKTLSQNNIAGECHNIGAWESADTLYFQGGKGGRNSKLDKAGTQSIEVNSVDNILNDKPASIIKLDVEGAEYKALIGMSKTILKYRPKLMLSAYHKNEDLFALPIKALELNPSYTIFLRHHPYIPAWETNYYIV